MYPDRTVNSASLLDLLSIEEERLSHWIMSDRSGPMPQSVDLPFTQGMDFGMGVNLVEGGIAGKAVDVGPITAPTGASGLTVSYNLQLISTVEDLYDSIGVSVSAGGRYGLFSAQGKVQYAKEVKFNSQSTFLLARCFVEKAFEQCEDATLKPT